MHVWVGSVARLSPPNWSLYGLLSLEERTRAQRFADNQRRQQYIVGRGLLRALVGSYLDRPPKDLVFAQNAFGKPCVADVGGLEFNVSHSHDLIALAFARQRRLGIDVQRVNLHELTPGMANRVFAARELADFRELDDQQKQVAFSRTWVMKEAYLKGIGCGLSQPLTELDVSPVHDGHPKLCTISTNGSRVSQWKLRELKLAKGYTAALAVEGHDWQLNCRFIDAIPELGVSRIS